MLVTVYRSSVKDGLYVYVQQETSLESLPAPVMKQLGQPEMALELDLDESRHLPHAESKEVLEAIAEQGFYIQMPRDIEAMMASIASRDPLPGE